MLIHKMLFGTCPCVLNTEVRNRVVPLYTEVSLFQRVRIERFQVSSFQEVGIE